MTIKSKKTKIFLVTFIFTILNIKLFYLLSNFEQIHQIWKYSDNVVNFYKTSFKYLIIFLQEIPLITSFLSLVLFIFMSFFWYYFFAVYFSKLEKKNVEGYGILSLFATIISFIGFGCVACGQTLIASLIFIFFSSGSAYLVSVIGNIAILVGILFLSLGIYKNYKLLHNKNICKI